jgi:hypothetical protein
VIWEMDKAQGLTPRLFVWVDFTIRVLFCQSCLAPRRISVLGQNLAQWALGVKPTAREVEWRFR